MITIYKTDTFKDAARYVTDVVKRVDKTNLSVMHTVLVPDRASMEAERALLSAVGGSFNAQVRTFRRLCADILPHTEYLSKAAGVMALSGIVADNVDKLTCFTKGVDTSGFVSDMYDIISTMKYCRITPNMLRRDDLPRGVRAKAADIALLYEGYLDYTANRFVDSADKMDLLCKAIANSPAVANGFFYLYDFDNLSAQELAIVEQLARYAKGVTVACCVGDGYADKYLYLNDIYNGITAMCKANGITPVVVEGHAEHANAVTQQIGKHMFRYDNPKAVECGNFVEMYQGTTRVQEVYALACRVQKYVRSGGRFRDIYVVTSDVAKYTNAVSTVFEEFAIPYFCDRQYALQEHPYARFVADFLALCRNNCKLSNVLNFVKNNLFWRYADGVWKDDVYKFENFCLKYNCSYNFEKFNLGRDDNDFQAADRFRKVFYDFYIRNAFLPTSTGAEYVAAVRKLIADAELVTRNEAYAEEQNKRAEEEQDAVSGAELGAQAKVTAQVAAKFEQVLVQAEQVLADRPMKLEEFCKTLATAVASVNVSVLPVTNDCVVFANMAKARKHDIKFLALLGANYGAMPIVKGDGRLLSDKNIADLQSVGVNVEPQMFVENKRERFSLFQLLQEPTDRLYVSYTATDGANSLTPSPIVAELSALFTVGGQPLAVTETADEEVYAVKQGLSKVVLNNRRLADNQAVHMPAFEVLCNYFGTKATKYVYAKDGLGVRVQRGEELYLKGSATSVSQLTDFFKCPYRFFVQYGLNVKPRVVAELKTADLGNILHAVLENYVKVMDVNETDEQTKQKALEMYETVLADDFYRAIRRDPQMFDAIEMLRNESVHLCAVVKGQLKNSDFVNYACELTFADSDNAEVPAVRVDFDGGRFNLVGKIDRVDKCGDDFVVIDYKSGAEAAKYTEKDLYVGHKMQLLVYMKAVRDELGFNPVGFYYFNIHDNFTDIDESKVYVYNGRTINDVDVAAELDNDLRTQGASKTLGLKLKKDGGFNSPQGKVISSAQIANQAEYAARLIRIAGNLMKQGYAAVSPYEGQCAYCDYKCICDFGEAIVDGERKVTGKVNAATIDNALDDIPTTTDRAVDTTNSNEVK